MYKREFEGVLRDAKLPNAMLFFGACNFQIEYFSQHAQRVKNVEEPLVLHFDSYDFTQAKMHLSQASLFGNSNSLIIKTDSQIPKKELDVLIDLSSKNSENLLIIECYNDDQKIRTMAKSFEGKNALNVRFFKPNTSEAIGLLKQVASQKHIDIDHFALNRLYEAQNENLSLAVNEFEKLSLLQKKIEAKDIDLLVNGDKSIVLEDLANKLINLKDIKEELKNIDQENEVAVVNFLQNYIVGLCNFSLYIKANGSCDSVAILGFKLPPKIEEERVRICKRFTTSNYKELLIQLANLEFALKCKTHYEKNSFLLHALLQLQSSIKRFGKS